MAIHVVKEPVPKPGTLGRTELYALAIGQVIGAGVITLIVPAIKMTGYRMAGVFRGDPDGICHDPSFRFHLFHPASGRRQLLHAV